MKDLYYHIEQDGVVLLSNMPKDLLKMASTTPIGRGVDICQVREQKKRWRKENIEGGTVYMCSYDDNITRKIFDYYFDALLMMYSSFGYKLQEMIQINTKKLHKLQHNVNTYNAKIKDELEALISLEDVNEKDWIRITDRVEDMVRGNTKNVAISLLKIAKNVALVNAEMDVYDFLQNSKGTLDIYKHPIHKVVKLSLQPFFLDFLEKGITIAFGTCKELVMIDFAAISVALGHFWNNAVKYAVKGAQIGIDYLVQGDFVLMNVTMVSLYITDEDLNNIFEEGYSGHWAKTQSLQGNGIGLYYIKKLMNLNKGDFSIQRGQNDFQVEGIPYSFNTFSFKFLRSQ